VSGIRGHGREFRARAAGARDEASVPPEAGQDGLHLARGAARPLRDLVPPERHRRGAGQHRGDRASSVDEGRERVAVVAEAVEPHDRSGTGQVVRDVLVTQHAVDWDRSLPVTLGQTVCALDVDEVAVLQRGEDTVTQEGDRIGHDPAVPRRVSQRRGAFECSGMDVGVQRELEGPLHRLVRGWCGDDEVEHRVPPGRARRIGAHGRDVRECAGAVHLHVVVAHSGRAVSDGHVDRPGRVGRDEPVQLTRGLVAEQRAAPARQQRADASRVGGCRA
jgi:hypothetical protein